ncbi:MAG: hypothetical protein KatS3mg110_2585 [Pirellulaceae bacterium]|nr:MAG: hypothetical protein KatS3mg110_2585 [Pirellulaceae bacterium]
MAGVRGVSYFLPPSPYPLPPQAGGEGVGNFLSASGGAGAGFFHKCAETEWEIFFPQAGERGQVFCKQGESG